MKTVEHLIQVLEDMKAERIVHLDVRVQSSLMDDLIIASGRSTKHVQALAEELWSQARLLGYQRLGAEGAAHGEWILVDLGEVVIHLMLEETRAFYELEKLWQIQATDAPSSF